MNAINSKNYCIHKLYPSFGYILEQIKESQRKDIFIKTINEIIDNMPYTRWYYKKYERALTLLDEQSKLALSEKAARHFQEKRLLQEYQPFFDQLNDCFAYEFLIRKGCNNVRILKEVTKSKIKSPDIVFQFFGEDMCCEVKTLGRSDNDIRMFDNEIIFSPEIYKFLQEGFLAKLKDKINAGISQIESYKTKGLIFIILMFDDFTLNYYKNYRKQISFLLTEFPRQQIFIKIGFSLRRYIDKSNLYR